MVYFTMMGEQSQLPINSLPFHQYTSPDGEVWTAFHRAKTGYLLRFPDLADFEVSADGHSVICYPAPDTTEETSRHLYFNQVLPLALSMLKKLVFHGSAVEVADAAIAFVAESGRGKSTLAASFAQNGFRFLTDDGLVIEHSTNGYQVLPSQPSIRLWSDSEEALVVNGEKTPALPFTSKSRFLAGADIAFCDRPRLLRRVYYLGDGSAETLVFQPMTGTEALMELVKHSFLLDLEERFLLASHFDMVAKLADPPIHFRLDYSRRFENLTSVRQAIVEHFNQEDNIV